jgi:hypothetical protein
MNAAQLAARNGDLDMLTILGELGCDMTASSHGGLTPYPSKSVLEYCERNAAARDIVQSFIAGGSKTKSARKT